MTRHKHLKLSQDKLDRAQRVLGARTESETVERALDLVIEDAAAEAKLARAHRRIGGSGGISDFFAK